MSIFWPSDINIQDTEPPIKILKGAKNDWEENSKGNLTLLFDKSTDETTTNITVYAEHTSSKKTATLFSIMHRSQNPYPVTIKPVYIDLPNHLKKSYYEPGITEVVTDYGFKGRTVENKWVSDTPSEFRSKLSDVFKLGGIKHIILSLVTVHSEGDTDGLIDEDV